MEPNNPIVSQTPQSIPPITTVGTVQQLEGPVSLLKSAWNLFKNNWKVIVPIVVAPSLLLYVGQLLSLAQNPAATIISAILMIAGLIMGIAMTPAAINAVHRLSTESGITLSFKDQYRFGFSMFWSILLLIIIQCLVVIGSFALLFIPGVIVSVYIGMYLFTRILDGKKGFSALTESFSLVKGRWWAVLGRLLFNGLIYIICAIILSIVVGGILNLFLDRSITSFIVSLTLSATLGPIMMIYIYNLYISLKNTRQNDVSTAVFKKWLIAFMIIGPIASIIMGILFVWGFISLISTMDRTKFPSTAALDPSQFSQMDENLFDSTD